MADVHNTTQRSYNMSRIRSKNTSPEVLVRKYLFHRGFRFRVNSLKLVGKPDLVLSKYKTVIFVNGCFWHGHNCPFFKVPGTHKEFWCDKIASNKANDQKVRKLLLASGWRVGVVWECALRGAGKDPDEVAKRLGTWLRSNGNSVEVRG